MERNSLGPYRLLREIGSGGMATVFLAEAGPGAAGVPAGERVALKVIHPHLLETPRFVERFLREVEVGRRIRHPNVVRTYAAGVEEDGSRRYHYLVMELVEGQTLRSLLGDLSWLPDHLCRHVGREVARGLSAIHEAGIIHRDLKPENVLITGGDVVKVMDLGISRAKDEAVRLSSSGQFVGSVLYAAPEQFQEGPFDGRADLYTLGLLLYELATGAHPFWGRDVQAVVRRQLLSEPTRPGVANPQISPFLEEVILHLLEKDPDRRFQTATEVAGVLGAGEGSDWWLRRSGSIRARTRRPLRRIRIPRESGLVGREAEIEVLRGLWRETCSGSGRVVVLAGETGVGKSRLVDEFVGLLEQEGETLNYLFVGGRSGGGPGPDAFSAAFREHLGADGIEEKLSEMLRETTERVSPFAALLRGEGSAGLEPEALASLFVRLARAVSADAPTVLLVDDLHLADGEGRALFAALAHALGGHRVLLAGAVRSEAEADWTAPLSRLPQVRRVTLERLRSEAVRELLGASLGVPATVEALHGFVHRKSGGNPFFAFEILRQLREEGILVSDGEGGWRASSEEFETEVPSSILEVVQARLSRLHPEQRAVLETAACQGFQFEPGLVARAAGLARIPALKLLSRLERSTRLVRSAGRGFVFDHELVREVLISELRSPRREALHAALGEAMLELFSEGESTDAGAEAQLCRHLLLGGAGERALPHLRPALEHLEGNHRNREARELLDLALGVEGLLRGSARVEMLARLSDRLAALERPEEEREALEEAIGLLGTVEDPGLAARVLLRAAQHAPREQALDRLGRAEELARRAGDATFHAAALGALGGACADAGRHPEARRILLEGLEVARASGDLAAEAAAEGNLALVLWEQGDLSEAARRQERCAELFRELGDRRKEGQALGNYGLIRLAIGDHEKARELFERHLAVCIETGYRRGEAMALGNLGMVGLATGRFDLAREHCERDLAIARELGNQHHEATSLHCSGAIWLEMGQLDRARAELREALRTFRDLGARHDEADVLTLLGRVALLAGEDGARDLLEQAADIHRETGAGDGEARARLLLAEEARRGGRLDQAREEAGQALGLAEGRGLANLRVRALCLGVLLNGEGAAEAGDALRDAEPRMEWAERLESRLYLWRGTGNSEHRAAARSLVDRALRHAPRGRPESLPACRRVLDLLKRGEGQ